MFISAPLVQYTAVLLERLINYRCVPLIRPPFCTLHPPKVEGGLIFEYAISPEYKPPPLKVLHERYVYFQSSCLHKNTVTVTFAKLREVNNNIHDDFAVAVLKNSNTVGHIPQEISIVCWYFLCKSGSEIHRLLDSTYLQPN